MNAEPRDDLVLAVADALYGRVDSDPETAPFLAGVIRFVHFRRTLEGRRVARHLLHENVYFDESGLVAALRSPFVHAGVCWVIEPDIGAVADAAMGRGPFEAGRRAFDIGDWLCDVVAGREPAARLAEVRVGLSEKFPPPETVWLSAAEAAAAWDNPDALRRMYGEGRLWAVFGLLSYRCRVLEELLHQGCGVGRMYLPALRGPGAAALRSPPGSAYAFTVPTSWQDDVDPERRASWWGVFENLAAERT